MLKEGQVDEFYIPSIGKTRCGRPVSYRINDNHMKY